MGHEVLSFSKSRLIKPLPHLLKGKQIMLRIRRSILVNIHIPPPLHPPSRQALPNLKTRTKVNQDRHARSIDQDIPRAEVIMCPAERVQVVDSRFKSLHEELSVDAAQSVLELGFQVVGVPVQHQTGDVSALHEAAVVANDVRVWVFRKELHGLGLLQ
jgi:hypothetical protein